MATNNTQHKVAGKIRAYAKDLVAKQAAEKEAAGEGAPDRMTTADGQGGITANKATIPKDVGESEVKVDQPTDGTTRDAQEIPGGGPDRLTVADGQGGITANKGTIPKDPGESEVKTDQPADASVRKAADLHPRAKALQAALSAASPEIAAKLNKSAKEDVPPAGTEPTPEGGAEPEKQAGSETNPNLDLSDEVLVKLARAALSTEEGVQKLEALLSKQAGREQARQQIAAAQAAAVEMNQEEQIKQAAFNEIGGRAEQIFHALSETGVDEEAADGILKQAALHQEKLASFDHPLLKQAYAEGMDDAALMSAADDAAGEEGVPPVDEALPAGGEELGEEDIMALIEEMLATGQITEEDVMEAIAMTEGGGEEMAAAPGAEAAAAPEEAVV